MWNMCCLISQVCCSFCFSSQLLFTFTKKVNTSQNSSCSFSISCFCSFKKHVAYFFLISPLLRFPGRPGDPLKYCNASAGCNESAYLQLLSRTSWCVGVMSCQKAVELLILQHGCSFGGKTWGKHAKLRYIIVGMIWCKIVEPSKPPCRMKLSSSWHGLGSTANYCLRSVISSWGILGYRPTNHHRLNHQLYPSHQQKKTLVVSSYENKRRTCAVFTWGWILMEVVRMQLSWKSVSVDARSDNHVLDPICDLTWT